MVSWVSTLDLWLCSGVYFVMPGRARECTSDLGAERGYEMKHTPTIEIKSEEQIALERAREQMRAANDAKAPGWPHFTDEYLRVSAAMKNTELRLY